ncbi:MAG: hypothetical protein ABF811_08005 [Pseudoclavibacter sp.]
MTPSSISSPGAMSHRVTKIDEAEVDRLAGWTTSAAVGFGTRAGGTRSAVLVMEHLSHPKCRTADQGGNPASNLCTQIRRAED